MASRFAHFVKTIAARWQLLRHRFATLTHLLGASMEVLAAIASVVLLGTLVILIGFDHQPGDLKLLSRLVKGCQIVFILNVITGWLFRHEPRGWLGKLVDGLVLLTAVSLIWPRPAMPWIPWLSDVFYNRNVISCVLAAYAGVEVSGAVMRIPGKRTNPSLLLSASFLVMILLGTLLLMLPKATVDGISFVDSLFLSTSAVCITGLTPVDVSTTFTPLGLAILGVLIEFGGLGLLTFTCFFALYFSGTSSIYSQLVMRDVVYSKSMSQLLPTMVNIMAFTLVIEIVGAVGFYFTLPAMLANEMTTAEHIGFAAFTSVSAFCNAGFTNLPGGFSNPALMASSGHGFYWIATAVIISGAVGFPLLVNLKDSFKLSFNNLLHRLHGRSQIFGIRPVHSFDMNNRIVATTFFALFIAGAAVFFFLEYDNTLAGMTLWEKITQAAFNSATPRSAGFSSVDPASFLNTTLLFVMVLMWIGGAAQSTAGGIKVNALAAVMLNLRSIVLGRTSVTAFGRSIARGSIARANAVLAISIFAYLAFSMLVMLLEPRIPTQEILFETCSALFTVGSSLGATSKLGPVAEIVLCVAMFLGRVGIVSLMAGLAGRARSKETLVSLPTDNIIIN